MRILFLIDSLGIGGAEKSLPEICSRFVYSKVFFLVLNPSKDQISKDYADRKIVVVNARTIDGTNGAPVFSLLLSQVCEIAPDIIHSTLVQSDRLSRRLGRDLGVPVVNSLINNTYCWRRYRLENWSVRFKLLFLQFWDLFTASRVRLFVSNSDAVKASYSRATIVAPDRIRTIYRGRSPHPFDDISSEAISDFRSSHGLNGKQVFLNVSRMIRRKGQSELLRAFAVVASQSPIAHLVIAGSGPLAQSLEADARHLNIASRVLFLGDYRDVPLLMRAADFFVFPSLYEGLPGVLIEAMLARLPILASDIPENREVLGAESALYHKVFDVDSLAEAMLQAVVVTDWNQRVDIGRCRAEELFNPDRVAKAYEALYHEILNRPMPE